MDCRHCGTGGLYLKVDIVHEGQEKRVEVSQEESKDAAKLPLQPGARVVILQGSDGFKQRGTEHPQQRHHDLHLKTSKGGEL